MLKISEKNSEENKSDCMLFCVCAFSCYNIMILKWTQASNFNRKTYSLQVTALLHWSFSKQNIFWNATML